MNRIRIAAAVVALLLLVPEAPPARAAGRTALTVGVIKIAALADIYAAQQLGAFDKEGLDVTLVQANNGNDLLTALQSGKIDIALAIPGTAMVARERGFKISFVYQNELAHAKAPDTGALLVKADAPIASLKQLAGKKIAHSGLGSQAWAAVRMVETRAGIDPSTLTELEVPLPQMRGTLAQGLVDAVVTIDPFTTQMLLAKEARVLSWFNIDSIPSQPLGAFWAQDDWLAAHLPTAKRFVAAMHQGLTYVVDHPEEAKRMVAEYTGLKPEITENMLPIRWSDKVAKADWQRAAQMMQQSGAVKDVPRVDDLMAFAAALAPGAP